MTFNIESIFYFFNKKNEFNDLSLLSNVSKLYGIRYPIQASGPPNEQKC